MIAALIAVAIVAPRPFSVAERNGRWLFVAPDGKPFWSLGVCCTGVGAKTEPKNPQYDGLKLAGNSRKWVNGTLDFLQKSGFNSIGGWSDTDRFKESGGSRRLPYFEVLHLGAYNKIPWYDMFSTETEQVLDKAAKNQILKLKNDPYLVGYFSDNELGWWREAIFKTYLDMDRKAAGKKIFLDFIRSSYSGKFDRFLADWSTKHTSFDQLDGAISLRPGQGGMSVVKNWQSFLTRAYYRKVNRLIRKYDPTRLVLGDRYCQFYYPNVAKEAAPFVDVISTNYGADWNDGGNTEYFLSALYQLTKKPVLITEFYMAAMENRSGNKNSSGGFPVVQTQNDRAVAVRNYMEDVSRRPYVVGAHWFQFHDEPSKGRGDGENYNMGLVDIQGEPYAPLIDVFKQFKITAANSTVASTKVPTLPKTTDGLKGWLRRQGLVKTVGDPPFADLYLSQQDGKLFVGLAAMSFTDESLYPGKRITEADRAELRLRIGSQDLVIRFGGKGQSTTIVGNGKVEFFRDGVRSELIVSIPLSGGDKIQVAGQLTSHGRADRMTWKDERTLR